MVLQIRDEQYAVLLEASRRSFEDRAMAHLRNHWSQQTKDVSEDELRDFVRDCRSKAEAYNITREVDVIRFTEVCLALGDDFDRSPQYPWARRILRDRNRDGEMKVAQLRYWVAKILDEIARKGD